MLTKDVIGARIKALRLQNGLSQDEFGTPIGLSRSAVSQIESGQTYPSIDSLEKIVKHYSTSWNALMAGESLQLSSPKAEVRTIVSSVSNSGNENISLVPIKAQAGYLLGAQQAEYIESLSTFWLPGLNNGVYRAFEISGYSMLADRIGFYPGDIAICEYVESLQEIKDGQVYVLVNNAPEVDNIVLKRCLNYLDKGGVIICKSDNKDPQYPTFPIQAENIKEVWKFKAKVTRQAPEPSGLYERMNSLEGDITMLKEQLQKFKAA
jgi:transcriptional regulator with XRE-family HTH domain